jgi:hypothetical protein
MFFDRKLRHVLVVELQIPTNPYAPPDESATSTRSVRPRPRKAVSTIVLLLAVFVALGTVSSDLMSELLTKGQNTHRYHVAMLIFGFSVSACLLVSASCWWRGRSVSGSVTLSVAAAAVLGAPPILYKLLFP